MKERKPKAPGKEPLRCLVVERHAWETGSARQQLQIPLASANTFFGSGAKPRPITVRLADAPSHTYECSVSKTYANGTRRINGLPFLGLLGPCFIFFMETDEKDVYEISCSYDVAIVVAHLAMRFSDCWKEGKRSQYGRGRLVAVVDGPIDHSIERMGK